MELIDRSYEGFYARFDPENQQQGTMLMGADNIVGSDYEIFFKTEDGINIAWAKNQFGAEVGKFDVVASRKLQLAKGRGQTIRAVLAYVGFSDSSEQGTYWGKMALFCFNPAYEAEMNAFIDRVAAKLSDGIRPKIDLGSKSVEKIFTEKDWLPSDTLPLPAKDSGEAIMKDRLTFSEKIIEQARAGNKGCYVISIAFLIVVAAAIIYFIAHLFSLI